jgi:hypothetical protein
LFYLFFSNNWYENLDGYCGDYTRRKMKSVGFKIYKINRFRLLRRLDGFSIPVEKLKLKQTGPYSCDQRNTVQFFFLRRDLLPPESGNPPIVRRGARPVRDGPVSGIIGTARPHIYVVLLLYLVPIDSLRVRGPFQNNKKKNDPSNWMDARNGPPWRGLADRG